MRVDWRTLPITLIGMMSAATNRGLIFRESHSHTLPEIRVVGKILDNIYLKANKWTTQKIESFFLFCLMC